MTISSDAPARHCSMCGETDPDKFAPSQKYQCRSCRNTLVKDWAARNPEKAQAIRKRTYQKNQEKRKAAHRAYYGQNREQCQQYSRDYRQDLKRAAYEAYGGFRCRCCGEEREVFLCLDHIADDGKEHRKVVGSTYGLYRWLRQNGYPPIMQVLCMNCNWAKRYGPCPHLGDRMAV